MNKLTGYILAVLGLIIVLLSFNLTRLKLSLPESIKPAYIMIIGLALVIIGVVFVMRQGKASQVSEEVPIYHGKKIVGYRRAK